MTDALIVPINVQAACVTQVDRENGLQWVSSTTQFQTLPTAGGNPGAYLSENCIYNPFDGAAPPSVGIHLHWALPTALARATFDASSNQHVFPDAPNRWLVVRTATAVDGNGAVINAPTSKSWVVESDYVNPNSPPSEGAATNTLSLAIPVIYPLGGDIKDSSAQSHCYIGGVYEGTTWAEGGDLYASHVPHLNALGCNGTIGTSTIQVAFGMPDFAIYYPNCCNVFGLHDNLSDLPSSGLFNLSYSVIGWYGPDANDPLKDPEFCTNAAWILPDGSSPTSSFSVYSGIVQSITWNPNTSTSVNFPDSLSAVLAPNAKEALAYYLQSVDQNTPHIDGVNIEQLLNVFQLGLFNEYNTTDLPLDVMEIWHQSRFLTQDGGISWVLQNPDSSKVMTDPNILNQLDQMNALQKKSDVVGHLLNEQSFQIFADWYKHLLSEYNSQEEPPDIPNIGIIQIFLRNQISSLIICNQQLNANLATQITQLSSQILSAAKKLDPNWNLQSIKAPRFWGARDPSVLIGGITPSSRYSTVSNLTCRLSSQILTALTVQKAITGTTDINCSSADFNFPNLPQNYVTPGLIDTVLSLARETALLDPNQLIWDILTQKKASVGTSFNTQLRSDLSTFPPVNSGLSWSGDLPSTVAFEEGQALWSPIMLQWVIDYIPNCSIGDSQADGYSSDFVSKAVGFDANGIDYVYNLTSPLLKENTPQEFSGSIFITPLAHLTLKQQLSHFFTQASTAPQKLQAEYAQLEKLKDYLTDSYPVMSQTLHGLTNLFSMRRQTIQLPVADPFEPNDPPTFSSQIQSAVGANNSLAPLITKPGYFNPIISGTFTLNKIRLIDAFGRFKDFSTKSQTAPANLGVTTCTSYQMSSSTPGVANLIPRVTQPCRLNCNFLSAADGHILTTTPINSSPICGWIVPDVLENNILLYANDAEATFLGTLVPEGNKFNLQPPFVMPPPAIKNPYFNNLIQGLTGVTPAQDFIDAISQALNTILPNFSHDPNFSTLLGWPLALVRVSLQMESFGGPIFQQSWAALESDVGDSGNLQTYTVDNIVFANRGNNKFPQVSFPTRVGNFVNLNDGVVGYFIESSGQPYQTFYPTTNTINLDIDPQSSTTTLSLIVDPRAAIHVAPGMLPVQSLEIPPAFFTQILTRSAIDFLVAPILSPALQALLPVPGGEPANQWSFYYGNQKSGNTFLPIEEVQTKAPLSVKNIQVAEGWLTST